MAASGVSQSSAQYSEDPATDQSHRSRLLHPKPRRRHSIQVVSGFPFLSRQPSFGHGSITPSENSNTNTNVSDNASNAHTHNRNRRQSISESLQLVTKSMSRWMPFINSLIVLKSLTNSSYDFSREKYRISFFLQLFAKSNASWIESIPGPLWT